MMTNILRQRLLVIALSFLSCNTPQGQFTEDEPDFVSLVGSYKLDLTKADCLTEADKVKDMEFVLNSDGTFSVKNFPIIMPFKKYVLCNGKGNWNVEQENGWNCWGIFVHYKSLCNSQTGDSLITPDTNYFVYGKDKPYKIYVMISDPELWYGLLFKKEK